MPKNRYSPQLGHKFNNWTVVNNENPLIKGRHYTWLCQCKCGSFSYLRSETIKYEKSYQCNKCAAKEKDLSSISKTHGKSRNKTYAIWRSMKQRCTNPGHESWDSYGGRGITVCDRWLESFENFLEDMGDKPEGFSLDRKNNNKGYSPDNCRWTDKYTQANNTRRNKLVEVDGILASISEHSRRYNMDANLVGSRYLQHDWPIELALKIPKNVTRKQYLKEIV